MTGRQDLTLIAGKPVRYRIRRSARARRLTLHVDRREGLVVVVPLRVPLREVAPLLAEQAAWIDRQVEKYGVRNGPVRREYTTGSEVLVLGRVRQLVIQPLPAARRRSSLQLADDRLLARLAPADILDPRPVLELWLRRTARRLLCDRVWTLAERVGLSPQKVIVGERTSRWGSCSGQGTLSFCYRLVMAPLPVIDAVIAHELCHLRHLNHGRRFYRLLDLACPDHRQQMAWLQRHEQELQL